MTYGPPSIASTETPISVDGVNLETLAYNIDVRTGQLNVPAVRGSDAQVPGRHGNIPVLNRPYDVSTLILSMWIAGQPATSTFPATHLSWANFYANRDTLQQLFATHWRLLDVRKTQPDGSVRQAFCKVDKDLSLSVQITPAGQMSVELINPYSFWQDVTATTMGPTSLLTTNFNVGLSGLLGATAPIDDAVFTVSGQCTNPKLVDQQTGAYVQYQGSLGPSDVWIVDSSAWVSTMNGTNVISSTVHVGGYRLLTVMPIARPNSPTVVFKADSIGTTKPTLTVAARRKYLT